jgi:hypothetical protein
MRFRESYPGLPACRTSAEADARNRTLFGERIRGESAWRGPGSRNPPVIPAGSRTTGYPMSECWPRFSRLKQMDRRVR